MTIRVGLLHETRYRFDRPVRASPHVVRLRPAPHCRTPVETYALRIEPAEHFIHWQQDPFGNFLARVTFPEPVTELAFTVDLVADLTVINPFDFFVDETAERFPFDYGPGLARELAPYRVEPVRGARFDALAADLERWLQAQSEQLAAVEPPDGERLGAAQSPAADSLNVKTLGEDSLGAEAAAGSGAGPAVPSRVASVDFLVEVNRRVAAEIAYTVRMEAGVQTPEETLKKCLGSCRDSAWLLVNLLRHFGLAARFVSGYLVQLAPDETPLDGPAGPERDFTDLHAWTEVFLPGAGWVGLDPTSGLLAGEGHLPLAASPQPLSAAAITGTTEPCESQLAFRNEVRRVFESPRVTRPYSDAQWAAIDALGLQVDAELERLDARLTMGGEPTFVSVDDMQAPEWTTAADGPHKRERAQDLVERLRARFASGGFVQLGQGKWYPGEPLPRWALNLLWRRDGQPLWQNPALLAAFDQDAGHGIDAARRLMDALLVTLGAPGTVLRDNVLAAYEDPFWAAWNEQNLPLDTNLDVQTLDRADARATLARMLTDGLATPRAWVLPLGLAPVQAGDRRSDEDSAASTEVAAGCTPRWETATWVLRGERLRLLSGDSPAGLRLPLDRLVFSSRDAAREPLPVDPFASRDALASPVAMSREPAAALRQEGRSKGDAAAISQPARLVHTAERQIRTALTIEPREGRLHVFFPPLPTLDAYVDLLAAVESAAANTGLAVVIEGYAPPADPRLHKLAVTPDPGVIEVNVHPARNWPELRDLVVDLYALARESRLAADKFMLDGRHGGTGGGNHVTLGGATPSDSPLLRRPDLLGSLVTYWQHHPGLSYLFSGMFIGPTSQAPRVDEARHENLYELEIALAQMPVGEVPEPWLVDRLFRNLLVDITGNTHRAEFCIDKLYSPDSASGRLGLLELRAFEMPPHARMSLVQMLLLRALVARFLREPYRHRLVRWGTALHDRFMLSHFVENDLREVCEELQAAGFAFAFDWLAPFFAFRFPVIGEVQVGELHLELRAAIEPWHVLGEEATGSGTARYVDSSVERLQLRVTGFSGDRYQVACNGRRVPLRPTRTQGERVAGVRYRAWSPSSALHPRIPVQSPLVFDVIDTWNGRAVGGCRYHVVHPGGRAYETFPVNAFEAEARRVARFEPGFHTPGWSDAPRVDGPPPTGSTAAAFEPDGSGVGPMAPPVEAANAEYPHTLDLRRPPEPGLGEA